MTMTTQRQLNSTVTAPLDLKKEQWRLTIQCLAERLFIGYVTTAAAGLRNLPGNLTKYTSYPT